MARVLNFAWIRNSVASYKSAKLTNCAYVAVCFEFKNIDLAFEVLNTIGFERFKDEQGLFDGIT